MRSVEQIKDLLTITPEQVRQVADLFRKAMVDGFAGRVSPLKMLPAHIGKPTGEEQGLFLALDFGGTNVRAELVELQGQGCWDIKRRSQQPLSDASGRYDYTTAATSASELFDFLAEQLAGLVHSGQYPLGHTFSFPCHQVGISQAVLISWTKEIKTAGVEGREIGALLTAALSRQGLSQVQLRAIINDTVGTLLTAAYGDRRTDIGAICGTGHNTCYYDTASGMIINMESGNFDILPYTIYDKQLDAASEKPSTQRLEKMVAGRYLGEVARYIAADLIDLTAEPYSIATEDLSALINEGGAGRKTFLHMTDDQLSLLKELASLVITRSARLVAATFLGVLFHIDPSMERRHTIAVDGSLYEKAPGYAAALEQTLREALACKTGQVKVILSKDGSGAGAAIAAAISPRSA